MRRLPQELTRRLIAVVALAIVLGGAGAAVAQPQPKLPPDFGMPKADSSPGWVTFSHAKHRDKVPVCTTCHAKEFKMKRGTSGPITLEAKQQGRFCGACHDGKASFPIDQCDACHKDQPPPAAPPAPAAAAPPAGTPAKPAAPGARAAPAAAKAEECLACHAEQGMTRSAPKPGESPSLFVDQVAFKDSSHGVLQCVTCHTTATVPHEALPRVPLETCAGCHTDQVQRYRVGVHGQSRQQGGTEAATCASCHGSAHAVLPKRDPRAPTYHLNLPKTCATCHADAELARRNNIATSNVYELYMDSIHGRAVAKSGLLVAANCSDCHAAHDIRAKSDPASRVFRANIPATCATCHAGVQRDYVQSVHGRLTSAGDSRAPVCTDCHTAHQIRRTTTEPWQLEVIRECGTCHEESLKTYRDTFHGKVTMLGFTRVAKCSDCHGSHTIQPASHPQSSVAKANVVVTCRQCHPNASEKFAEFHPHADPHSRERFPKLYYVWLVMTTLLVGTFGFFGLHTLLWLPRSFVERWRHRRGGGTPPSVPPAAPEPGSAPEREPER